MNDLCTKGAGELARMIPAGKTKSTDIVEAHLERIEETNPAVNAVTVTLADEARAAAALVDRAVAAFAEQVATRDAPIVARLREAGAIPLARTNLPDFAFRWDTSSQHGGGATEPADFGDADGSTSYALCVYDALDAIHTNNLALYLRRNPRWRGLGSGDGWRYLDRDKAAADGLRKVRLRAKSPDKTIVDVLAGREVMSLAPAAGPSHYFDADPDVTVQLINSDGECWGSTFTAGNLERNTQTDVKAKVSEP